MRSMTPFLRILFIALGSLSLTAGVVGIFLPLLPTTPFLILAAYFFSRSSKTLHTKMLTNRFAVPIITQWQRDRTIPLRVKILATTLLSVSLISLLIVLRHPLLRVCSGVFFLVAVGILWRIPTRKSG